MTTQTPLNKYGDSKVVTQRGFGVDISSQRLDDLDLAGINEIKERNVRGEGVHVVEIGCGSGGLAFEMAKCGAAVLGIDVTDHSVTFASRNLKRLTFRQADITKPESVFSAEDSFTMAVSQRTIHYLRHTEAVAFMVELAKYLRPGSNFYLSASGLHSELGTGYAAKDAQLHERFAPLAPEMAEKHGIHHPVCLYSEQDMHVLGTTAGYRVERIFTSPFGNVKAILCKPPKDH